jgi:hypothetical protein
VQRRRQGTGEESAALIQRSPLVERACIRASSATITEGNSDAGSAWARLPPIVPRLRI